MKKEYIILLAIFVLWMSFYSSYIGKVVQECEDTDDLSIFSKGKVIVSGIEAEDECVENKVQEFYCENNNVKYEFFNCPSGCFEGACKPEILIKEAEFESFKIESGGDKLEINEKIGDVIEAVTENDVEALKGGKISTRSGLTSFNQYLRFKDTNIESGKIILSENENDRIGNYLYFQNDKYMFEYEIDFEDGLKSDISNNKLVDLEGKKINILSRNYDIIDAKLIGNEAVLKLVSGEVGGNLEVSEETIYTINDIPYQIKVLSVEDETKRVSLLINGKEFDIKLGEVIYVDGIFIGIPDVIVNEAGEGEDRADFFLGAQVIELRDKYTDDSFSSGTRVNGFSVTGGDVKIKGTKSGDELTISNIKYRLKADAKRGGDIFVSKGHTLREYLDYEGGMFGWDIRYNGLSSDDRNSLIRISPNGDDEYDLGFSNNKGQEYVIDFVVNKNGNLELGDENNDLYFIEGTSISNYIINKNDWFVAGNNNGRTGITNILRYNSIDTSGNTITFNDLAAGNKNVVYTGTEGTDAQGDLVVSGNTYRVHIGGDPDNKLAIDMNGDGDVNSDEINIVVNGGGIIDLGSTNNPGSDFSITLKTEASSFDENADDEIITVNILKSGSNVDLSIPSQSGLSIESDDDQVKAMSNYGAYLVQDRNGADSLKIYYPKRQSVADVELVFYKSPEYIIEKVQKIKPIIKKPSKIEAKSKEEILEIGEPLDLVIGGATVQEESKEIQKKLNLFERIVLFFKILFGK